MKKLIGWTIILIIYIPWIIIKLLALTIEYCKNCVQEVANDWSI